MFTLLLFVPLVDIQSIEHHPLAVLSLVRVLFFYPQQVSMQIRWTTKIILVIVI
jgi:hypothetical protein